MMKQITNFSNALLAPASLAVALLTGTQLATLPLAYAESADEQQQEALQEDLREYDVELIIFEDAHARYIHSESWQQEAEDAVEPAQEEERAATEQAAEAKQRDFTPRPVGILDRENRRLGLSSEVKILYRTAWRQPGLDEEHAFDIDLDELKNWQKPVSDNSVSGSFRLVLGRYLHLYADIDYHRPVVTTPVSTEATAPSEAVSEQAPQAAVITDFKFDVHRKMRSKELHYIDHPLIGMLVEIIPVEKPEEPESPQS